MLLKPVFLGRIRTTIRQRPTGFGHRRELFLSRSGGRATVLGVDWRMTGGYLHGVSMATVTNQMDCGGWEGPLTGVVCQDDGTVVRYQVKVPCLDSSKIERSGSERRAALDAKGRGFGEGVVD